MDIRVNEYFTRQLSKDAPSITNWQQPDRHVRRLEKLRSRKEDLLSTFLSGLYFPRFAAETFRAFVDDKGWGEFYRSDTFKAEVEASGPEFLEKLITAGKAGLARAFDQEIIQREEGLRHYFMEVQQYVAGIEPIKAPPLHTEVFQLAGPDQTTACQGTGDGDDGSIDEPAW